MGGSDVERLERLDAILLAAQSLMQVLGTVRALGLPDWLVFSGAVISRS